MARLVFDMDGVIANFVQSYLDKAEEVGGFEDVAPCCWRTVDSYLFLKGKDQDLWRRIQNDRYFWLGIKPMPGVRKTMITEGIFPDLYLTSRPIPSYISQQWILQELFPHAPVVTVAKAEDKIHHLTPGDVLVDDLPSTVRLAQQMGVTALLMDAPFHRGEPAGSLEGLTTIKCVSEAAQYLR
jgi:hypothetical protein